MNARAEQRRHFRKRVFKLAHIVIAETALECCARDLSAKGTRLCLSTTYGIPNAFDVIIDGKRRPGTIGLENLHRNGRDLFGCAWINRPPRFRGARERHCSADRTAENG